MGDCKTLLFVQISPSSVDLEETLSSLNFASKVWGIENRLSRKHVDGFDVPKAKKLVMFSVVYSNSS